jgi:hypothetical protein
MKKFRRKMFLSEISEATPSTGGQAGKYLWALIFWSLLVKSKRSGDPPVFWAGKKDIKKLLRQFTQRRCAPERLIAITQRHNDRNVIKVIIFIDRYPPYPERVR